TGGAIFKAAELPRATCGGAACISRVIPPLPAITSINQWQNTPGTGVVNPLTNVGGVRGTNYSGPSTLFGDIVAITAGPCNVIYAAVSPSFVAGPVSFDQ